MTTAVNKPRTVSESELTALINDIAVAAHGHSLAIASNREEGQHLVVVPLLEANKLVDVYQKIEALPGPEHMNGAQRLLYWIQLHQAARDQAIADRLAHEASLTPYQKFTDLLTQMGVRWDRNETNVDGDQSISIDSDEVGSGHFIHVTFNRGGEYKQFDVYAPSQVHDSMEEASEPNSVGS